MWLLFLDITFHLNNLWPRSIPEVIVGILKIVLCAILSGTVSPPVPDLFIQSLKSFLAKVTKAKPIIELNNLPTLLI